MTLTMRTIKIALATVVSVWIASALQLLNPLSAGIIAILSVLDTRRASLETAVERFLSTLLALSIATVLFLLLGYGTWVFGLYLVFYVPLAYKFGLQAGIPTCSVLVTHLMVEESVAPALLGNEVMLMVIGAGTAILFHVYMPHQEKEMNDLKQQIEAGMTELLMEMDRLLREDDPSGNMKATLEQLDADVEKAEHLALIEYDNQIFSKSNYYVQYFRMRNEQLSILKRMAQNFPYIGLTTEQNAMLGGLFYLTADQLHELNTGEHLLEDVDLLHEQFRTSALPQTRAEFESRAIQYQMLIDLKRFLEIKKSFLLKTHQNANRDQKNAIGE